MKYRYRIKYFDLIDGKTLTSSVSSTTLPLLEFKEDHNDDGTVVINSTWKPITVGLIDDGSDKTISIVVEQIKRQMEYFNLGTTEYKFHMEIEVLEWNKNNVLQDWYLDGCFFKTVDYHPLDETGRETLIEITISYDNAVDLFLFY
jgi:hypothetical protein